MCRGTSWPRPQSRSILTRLNADIPQSCPTLKAIDSPVNMCRLPFSWAYKEARVPEHPLHLGGLLKRVSRSEIRRDRAKLLDPFSLRRTGWTFCALWHTVQTGAENGTKDVPATPGPQCVCAAAGAFQSHVRVGLENRTALPAPPDYRRQHSYKAWNNLGAFSQRRCHASWKARIDPRFFFVFFRYMSATPCATSYSDGTLTNTE